MPFLRFAYRHINESGQIYVWLAHNLGFLLTIACALLFFLACRLCMGPSVMPRSRNDGSLLATTVMVGRNKALLAVRIVIAAVLLLVHRHLLIVPMFSDSLHWFYLCCLLAVFPCSISWCTIVSWFTPLTTWLRMGSPKKTDPSFSLEPLTACGKEMAVLRPLDDDVPDASELEVLELRQLSPCAARGYPSLLRHHHHHHLHHHHHHHLHHEQHNRQQYFLGSSSCSSSSSSPELVPTRPTPEGLPSSSGDTVTVFSLAGAPSCSSRFSSSSASAAVSPVSSGPLFMSTSSTAAAVVPTAAAYSRISKKAGAAAIVGSSVVEDEEQGEVDPKVALPSSGLMDSTTHHQLAASYSFSEFNSNPNSSSLSSPSPVHPLCTSLHGRQELHHGKQQQHQQQRWYTRLVLSTATVVVQAYDRCAGVNPQFQPHVRLARRLMLAIVLLYWALVFHVHVFAIEPREHYQLVNRIPEPRCQCTGDTCQKGSAEDIFRSYQVLHQRILRDTPRESQRFLYFTASESGLGNRMQALTSAFLVALLTDRALVVDWRAHVMSGAEIDALFQHPGFDWSSDEAFRALDLQSSASEVDHLSFPYCRTCSARGGPVIQESYSRLLCSPDGGLGSNRRVLQLYSTQWFAPALAHNPALRQKICGMLGDDLFGTLARFLFRPVSAIQEQIDSIKAQFDRSHRVVAVQIRANEAFALDEEQLDSMRTCAAAVGDGLAKKAPRSSSDSDGDKQQAGVVRWFVASDNEGEKKKLRQMLGDRLITHDAPVSKSLTGMAAAVVDMWLLGEADEMVISPYSTFGFMAHGRTSIIPHLVSKTRHCFRLRTSQPCFQYWFAMPLLPCWKNSMLSTEVINQHDCMV